MTRNRRIAQIRVFTPRRTISALFQSASEFPVPWEEDLRVRFVLYGAILGCYRASSSTRPQDTSCWSRYAFAAARMRGYSARAGMFGMVELHADPRSAAIAKIFDKANPQNTRAVLPRLRRSRSAVTMPHGLMLLPYGKDNRSTTSISWRTSTGRSRKYCWATRGQLVLRCDVSFSKPAMCVATAAGRGVARRGLRLHVSRAKATWAPSALRSSIPATRRKSSPIWDSSRSFMQDTTTRFFGPLGSAPKKYDEHAATATPIFPRISILMASSASLTT